MLSNGLKPHTIDVTTQMRKSCRAAHQRYLIYLDDVKKQKAKEKNDNVKEIIGSEIREVQGQISDIEKTCKMLDKKFIKLVNDAEKQKDFKLITEANALKRKSEEKSVEKEKLEEALNVLEAKRKKL